MRPLAVEGYMRLELEMSQTLVSSLWGTHTVYTIGGEAMEEATDSFG
jgi:hypothetical protein